MVPRHAGSPGPDSSIARAELSVIADAVDRHRDQVAAIAERFLGAEREDVIAVIHEAERQLLIAFRTLQRAIKTLER